ncbi:hypothetical protein [Planctobacterium marinum]|uniref:hypothetical protein n=1 Tax=Planctobacterium marinum TaxID=1631968 RepID=UPI001E3139E8|nr:hypothetical protein [Planctobacterium marinum]MCC2606594.1 hypothetical protein [Planctobacterium marinum]
MDLTSKSDAEIHQIAEPIYRELVEGSNTRNWDVFTKYAPEELKTPELKRDVEEQWKHVPFLTSLSEQKELLGILRRGETIHVLWKQWSLNDDMQYLGVLILQNQVSPIRVNGFFFK